jgi:diacylglycerol kinase
MTEQNKNFWRKVSYKQKFENAFRGLYVFWQATRHVYVHSFFALLAVCLGFYFKISGIEWALLVFAIGFVIVSEVFNTAIEIDIDLTSPEYHPFARDTKDVAAAAVLLSVFTSIIIGLIIFLPKIL